MLKHQQLTPRPRQPLVNDTTTRHVLIALVGGAVLTIEIIGLLTGTLALAVSIASAPIILTLLRHRFESPLFSPVWIIVSMWTLLAITGYCWANALATRGISGASFSDVLADDLRARTAQLLSLSCLSIVLGSAFYTVVRPHQVARIDTPFRRVPASTASKTRLLLFSLFPAILIILDGGPGSLLFRSGYLRGAAGSTLAGLGTQLAVAAVVVLGFIIASGGKGHRSIALVMASMYVAIFFSLGTRRLALVPILLVLGTVAARNIRMRWSISMFAFALLSSLWLVQLPLQLRGLPQHGLIPYLAALPHVGAAGGMWAVIGNNLLVSFRVVGATAYSEPPVPAHNLLVQFNPLPGDMAGWYEIAAEQRLNRFTPYAAIGELRSAGLLVLVATLGTIGFFLGYLERRVRSLLNGGQQAFALSLVGLAALFALNAIEYNLRTCLRMLLYAILVDMLARLVHSRGGLRVQAPGRVPARAAEGTKGSTESVLLAQQERSGRLVTFRRPEDNTHPGKLP